MGRRHKRKLDAGRISLAHTEKTAHKKLRGEESGVNNLLIGKRARISFIIPDSRGYRDRWYAHLRSLLRVSPRLFSDLEPNQLGEREDPGYRGIGITVDNCIDLRRIYDVYYKPRLYNQGRGGEEFKLVTMTMSQYMRWTVTTSKRSKWNIWEEGALFESAASIEVVQSFLEYFVAQCAPSTVRSKAIHLKRVCDVGSLLLNNGNTRDGCKMVSLILRSVSSASTCAHRTICQERKRFKRCTWKKRISSSTLTMTKQWALDALGFVMRSYWRQKERDGGHPTSVVSSYMKMWCTNFTSLLLLVSGGQRPQVFSQLQVPNVYEYEHLKYPRRSESYIELRTVDEKRPRYLDLPYLILPRTILPHLIFHIEVIRPGIRKMSKTVARSPHKPLLLHAKTGKGLKPAEITSILQRFLTSHKEGLGCITTMDVRRTYATMMHELYRNQQIFCNLSEAAFLRKVSFQMNTSPEQLRRTYMSEIRPEFNRDTADLVEFWGTSLMKSNSR